jgi:hypothetical protein
VGASREGFSPFAPVRSANTPPKIAITATIKNDKSSGTPKRMKTRLRATNKKDYADRKKNEPDHDGNQARRGQLPSLVYPEKSNPDTASTLPLTASLVLPKPKALTHCVVVVPLGGRCLVVRRLAYNPLARR